MSIDWAALGQVSGISLLVTVGFVGVFTLGILGTSRKPQQAEAGTDTAATASTASAPAGGAFGPARAGAYLCFALCAAVVAYGINLIVA
ncbi:hypothetical protein SBI_08147 [Streptomyces bingchenggensis BCW-1]|uniref:Uncharacterized protein n=1 Tax=Streptomyces bingchenggensis (strain BCW-1) TaxID=749414 RepID=D7CI87_STRBB|nr:MULTISPECIES: hypothetical protein [Streptomyces]ADI11265.1 hypothetical protein SBI_08147 [Streptomyces bingchenggensis BCW-1]